MVLVSMQKNSAVAAIINLMLVFLAMAALLARRLLLQDTFEIVGSSRLPKLDRCARDPDFAAFALLLWVFDAELGALDLPFPDLPAPHRECLNAAVGHVLVRPMR